MVEGLSNHCREVPKGKMMLNWILSCDTVTDTIILKSSKEPGQSRKESVLVIQVLVNTTNKIEYPLMRRCSWTGL